MADGVSAVLNGQGYTTDILYSGEMGVDHIKSGIYDLVLLDILLPGMDGLEILRAIRSENNPIPIILLTARSLPEDKIKGLDLGADDYLTKPFDSGELLARVRARLRNRYDGVVENNMLSAFDVRLDKTSYKLIHDENSIKLSNKEYQFMEYLMVNKGIILSRDMIIAKVWGIDDDVDYNSPDVYVSFLRKKLKFIKAGASIITKKGVGYSLERTYG